jgi:sugar/nucleoside kinase (ribokinase family)
MENIRDRGNVNVMMETKHGNGIMHGNSNNNNIACGLRVGFMACVRNREKGAEIRAIWKNQGENADGFSCRIASSMHLHQSTCTWYIDNSLSFEN